MIDAPPAATQPPVPKKRRRWLRRLTWFVVFLGALVTAAPFALALKPVREFLASQVSKKLGRTTTIGGASGSWWGGFEVRDVEVRNPDGWQGDPLLSVDRVHVDLKIAKLVTGSIDATVDVEKPVVTLLRTKDGRSNADGLMPDDDREAKAKKPGDAKSSMPSLVVRVRNGRVVAQEVGAGAGAADEIDAITLDAETGPDGHKIVAFSAVAKRAARGGGDAEVRMDARLTGSNEGPITLTIPTVDLARLSRIVTAATGLEDLTGTFEANARLAIEGSGRTTGTASATLAGLSARSGTGRFQIDSAGLDVKPSVEADQAAFDMALTIKNLSASGFSNRDAGLSEPAMSVRGKIVRSANGDLAFGSPAAPLTITGRSLSGTVSGSVRDLASDAAKADVKAHIGIVLSPTLGRLLGAISSPDDDLRGTVAIDASATGTGGAVELLLSGSMKDALIGGASGEAPFREPAITFDAAGSWAGKAKRLTLSKGSVASGAVSAQVKPGFVVDMVAHTSATGQAIVDADLAAARPMLGVFWKLAPDASLAGKLVSKVTISSNGDAMTVGGKTTITALHYVGGRDPLQPAAAPTTFDEPSVAVEHDLTLGAAGEGSMRLDKVTLSASVLSASAGGSMRGSGDARVLDLTVKLDADASKLAERLRTFMGAGYEDTTGDGRITGQVLLSGPTANHMRDLKIDATLAYQRFSSGGLTAESGNIRLVRPNPATPLVLTMTSTINRGTVRVDGTCDLGRGESPWSSKVAIKGLDTSPLLTNRGAGRYLALVMPAIVPAEATSNVLSGLLDADLDLKSLATDQPRLAQTLSGPGSVRMTQGSVKDSTIFSSLAGDGAGKGIAALVKLAPGIGHEFQNLSKALLFQSLSSTFTLGNRKIDLHPVELQSQSANLKFSGSVDFDGGMNLAIPLQLGGDAGKAIEPYIPNRTIPLKVSGKAGSLHVTPDLSPESFVTGGLLDKGKDVLEGLFGGKKKK